MKAILTEEEVSDLINCLQHAKDPCATRMIDMLKTKTADSELKDRIRNVAREEHHEDGVLEFDEGCVVSIDDTPDHVPDGAYVQGWFWVPNPDQEEPNPIPVPSLGCEIVGLKRGHYVNNPKAIAVAATLRWLKPEAGMPPTEDQVISVNITEDEPSSDKLEEGQFYVKNWSENEAIVRALLAEGIIQEAGGFAAAGHISAPLCFITPKGLKLTTDDLN